MNQPHLAYTSDNPKLDYRVIIRKILNGNFGYIFGRFYIVRKYYSYYKRVKQFSQKNKIANNFKFDTQILNHSNLDIPGISSYIHNNSYYDQLELNQQSVAAIVADAKTKKLIVSANSLSFTYLEYLNNIKPYHKIATADVEQPLKIKEVYNLRYDSYLLEISSQYLGYYPTNCDIKLWWSFADTLSPEERRSQFQTIDYHYDIHGFNFFYVSFYLTDVDISGCIGKHNNILLQKLADKHIKIVMYSPFRLEPSIPFIFEQLTAKSLIPELEYILERKIHKKEDIYDIVLSYFKTVYSPYAVVISMFNDLHIEKNKQAIQETKISQEKFHAFEELLAVNNII